jgi:hypothetical protein
MAPDAASRESTESRVPTDAFRRERSGGTRDGIQHPSPKVMHDRDETSEVRLPVLSDGRRQGEESLPAVTIAPGRYRLVASPGFVEGLAAGDEFELSQESPLGYRVLRRSGNLCVWFYFDHEVGAESYEADDLSRTATSLGGRVDGGWSRMLVLTLPLSAGWSAIEASLNAALERVGGSSWLYGNVYDPRDGETPLGWWEEAG